MRRMISSQTFNQLIMMLTMAIHLLILLSVVIVVGAAIAAALIFALRRKKTVQVARNYNRIAPFLITQTARLSLRSSALPSRADVGQGKAAQLSDMGSMWANLAAKGVKRLGTLKSKDGRRYIVGQHPVNNMIALVVCQDGIPPFLEFIVLSPTNNAMIVTGDPAARALQLATLNVVPMRSPTYTPAVKTMAAMLPGRPVDMRILILLVERLHAARMDSQLAKAPSLQDMNAHAAVRHVTFTLTDDEQQHALELNRKAWLDAVRLSLLDHGRRKLQLDEESWDRLESDLIVVHEGMSADDVMALLPAQEVAGKLGDGFAPHKFGPVQLFEQINRRLDADDQRRPVLSLGSPVQGRLFARTSELQACGAMEQAQEQAA
jgi:hypothetical protein